MALKTLNPNCKVLFSVHLGSMSQSKIDQLSLFVFVLSLLSVSHGASFERRALWLSIFVSLGYENFWPMRWRLDTVKTQKTEYFVHIQLALHARG